MIDRDGIVRPDSLEEHVTRIKRDKELIIDENYKFWNRSFLYRFFQFALHSLVYLVMAPALKLKYGIRITGRRHLKRLKHTGFITIYNHVHLMDTTMISANIFRFRPVHYLTLKENLQMPFVRHIIRLLGAFPIPDSYSSFKQFNKSIDEMLEAGEVVFIAPEGVLWHEYREIRPFKSGAFAFSARNMVPILPIAITFRTKKTLIRRIPKKKVNLEILKPLYPNPLIGKKENEQTMLAEAQDIFWKKVYEAYPDLKDNCE